MASFQLLTAAAEILRRPVRLAALSLSFAGVLALTASPAAAQHQFPQGKQQWTAPCLPGEGVEGAITDGEPAVPEEGDPTVPDAGSEVPDVADLGADSGFASAGQSAAPNVIGDTVSFGSCGILSAGGATFPVCFNGGRKFKATVNQSAIPQNRVFYELNHFDSALTATGIGSSEDIDITRHTFGFERMLDCCGCSSIQVQIPFHDTIGNDVDLAAVPPVPTDVRFGNISIAYKRIIRQCCCQTWTAGLALDLPTGSDTTLDVFGDVLEFDNKVITLTPFLAFLDSAGCGCSDWTQGFLSVDLPLNSHTITEGVDEFDVDELTILNLDLAVGKWLHQDCCGNGVAAVAEVHYSTSLDGDEVVDLGAETFTIQQMDVVNLTLGAQIQRNCWTITPAYVTPISDDELFDWEFALHVNRRF